MTRKYSFEYRRRHPKMFPEVCDVCKPKRRFRAPANKVQHEESIQQQRIYDHPMHRTKSSVSYPPSSSSLSTITASDLNKFVKKEIEPDTEYNKSCKEVVDCLCQFMKNEFPDELRVSEIVKESTGKKRLPSSYPLELITIAKWEDAGKPVKFDLRKGFYHVLLAIANYKKLKRAWNINYDADQYTSGYSYYVMDPANPFNNVMDACNCWDLVENKIREFLHMPLFSELSKSSGWT